MTSIPHIYRRASFSCPRDFRVIAPLGVCLSLPILTDNDRHPCFRILFQYPLGEAGWFPVGTHSPPYAAVSTAWVGHGSDRIELFLELDNRLIVIIQMEYSAHSDERDRRFRSSRPVPPT